MEFLNYLQQVAKLSDRQIDALRQSKITIPTDLQSLNKDDLDDLLHGADPEHFISSRYRAKLDLIHEYIRSKHDFVPGKTPLRQIIDAMGDEESGYLLDTDDSSSNTDWEQESTIKEIPSTRVKNNFSRQKSAHSVGWGYASTASGSSRSIEECAKGRQTPRRGGRRMRRKGENLGKNEYSSHDTESGETGSASDFSFFEQGDGGDGSIHTSQRCWCIIGCLALTLGACVGSGAALFLF